MVTHNNPEVFWQMSESIDGISEACLALETPVISGNVSMYNQSKDEAILPTPIIGMVGLIEHTKYVTPSHFQNNGDLVYLIGETFPEFGGSELQKIIAGKYSGKAPAIDLQVEAKRQNSLATAIREGLVVSAHDLSEGGLAVALAESLFKGQGLGAQVNVTGDATVALFSESQSRFLVTVKAENKEQFEKLWTDASQIGSVTNDGKLTVSVNGEAVIEDTVDELHKLWSEAIPVLVAK